MTIDSTWGGSIGVTASLTVSGNLILASGTLGGNGAVTVAGSGSQFSGGTLSGNFTNAGTLTVAGSGTETLGGTLTNTGTIDVTGTGNIDANANSTTIDNQAGATFNFQADAALSNPYGGTGLSFSNAGLLEMTASTGMASISFPVTDTGTLNATNGGTLLLESSTFTPSGVIEAGAGSTISISDTIDNTGAVVSATGTGTVAITGTVDGGTIDVGTATNLVLAGSTLDNVTLDGAYQLAGNKFIYVQDNLTLDGTLTLGNGSNYGVLYFDSEANQTLGGSGTVIFSGTNSDDTLGTYKGSLTIGSGITVQGQSGFVGYSSVFGSGTGGVTVTNQGTIQANVSGGTIYVEADSTSNAGTFDATGGTIYVEAASTSNTGTFDATDGGTLSLSSTFTPGGVIEADQGSTIIIGGTIANTGGVFSPIGSGTVAITGTVDGGMIDVGTATNLVLAGSTLNNVTLDGTYQLTGNALIYVENDLILDGTLTLGSGGNYGVLYFVSQGNQTLGGSGTVIFSGTNSNNTLGTYNGSLTIGSGITVQGQSGFVGYSPVFGSGTGGVTVTNQGTIQANVSGGTIYVEDVSTPNTGTLQATDGGTLSLQSSTFTPGGVIESNAGSTITIGGTIDNTGGTFSPIGSGTVAITGTVDGGTIDVGAATNLALAYSTLNNVTLDGTYQLTGNALVYIENDLILDGTLTLGSGGNYGVLYFVSQANQTLGGSGTVIFSGTNSDNTLGTYNGSLTIGSGITVQGQSGFVGNSPVLGGGTGGITVTNQGTIQANVSGGTIYVEDVSTPNTGTLQATDGGTLSLQSSTFTPGGVIEADQGSTITIGGTIANTGGVFSPIGSGTVAITGTVDGGTIDVGAATNLVLAGSTLNNVTLDGTYQLTGNALVYIENNLILDGTLTLGSGGNYGVLYFASQANQTLGGSGTVIFSGTNSDNTLGTYNGSLTIGSGITVQGQSGFVGYSPVLGGGTGGITVTNQGTIQANVSGGTIYVEAAAPFQNSGTLNASAGTINISTGSYGTVNSGTISAGPTGSLYITGPFIQTSTATLDVVLGGSSSGLYGQVAIGGTASLNGT